MARGDVIGLQERSSAFAETAPFRHCVAKLSIKKVTQVRAISMKVCRQADFKTVMEYLTKIQEVDKFLHVYPEAGKKILEAHPELSFAGIADHPMRQNKKTGDGFEERFQLLVRHLCNFKKSYDRARCLWRRSKVADDDLMDASILSLAALEKDWHLKPLSVPPEFDSDGLPMQILSPAWE